MKNREFSSEGRKQLSPARRALLQTRIQQAKSAAAQKITIPSYARSGYAPLSLMQEGVWVSSQFDLDIGLFNRPVVLWLRGELDYASLKQALEAVIQRHEVLRCRIRLDLGKPLQQIEPSSQLTVQMIDLREFPPLERKVKADQFIANEVRAPINLAKSPLLRASLLKLDSQEHVLVLVFHHISFDAWSERVLLSDLGVIYSALILGRPFSLNNLPIQYADFAAYQREQMNTPSMQKQIDYWKNKLADLPPALEFPTDHPRPRVLTSRGASYRFSISGNLRDALEALGKCENATLYMVLLSAFITLLAQYSGQQIAVVGMPVAGRMLLETEGLIGLFINTLILSCDLSGEPTFIEVLHRVRQTALEAYSNQEVPLEKLVEVIPFKRDLSRSPFFQVLFNYENLPFQRTDFYGLSVEPYIFESSITQYDLSLELIPSSENILANFVYNRDLYDHATIQNLAISYISQLEKIIKDPGMSISLPASRDFEQRTSIQLVDNLMSMPESSPSLGTADYADSALDKFLGLIWSDILNVEKINPQTHFFESGGHSLLAIRMIARINDYLGIEIPFSLLYEASIFSEFVARLRELENGSTQLEEIAEVLLANYSTERRRIWGQTDLTETDHDQFIEHLHLAVHSESVMEFIFTLRAKEVYLWVEGEKLKFSAPPGIMTSDLREGISNRREEILAYLKTSKISPRIGKVSSSDNFPLSFAQQRLFIIHQLDPKSPAYNLDETYRISGDFDPTLLERSVNEIVKRHSILRANFVFIDGVETQIIQAERKLVPNYLDLLGLPSAQQLEISKSVLEDHVSLPFDFSSDPLLRILLIHLADGEWIIQFVFHHIITDLWSYRIFFKELFANYEAFMAGKVANLPALPLQYVDYAVWQKSWLSGANLERQLAYWKERLKPPRAILSLPTDRPRPAEQSSNGTRLHFEIPNELYHRLRKMCLNANVTMFMLTLSVLDVLLYRYTGEKDVSIGVPVANRTRYEFDNLIGFFVNTLVLRLDLSGSPIFQKLLEQVRMHSLDAYEHQDMPFERLVEVLNPPRHRSHSPLFQVGFAYQNIAGEGFHLPDMKINPFHIEKGVSRFDLTLFLIERQEILLGMLEYNSDLFDQDRVERAIAHYIGLLEQILDHPDWSIDRFEILTENERRQINTGWNKELISFPPEKCLHELFEIQARLVPDEVAVVFDKKYSLSNLQDISNSVQSVTYSELNGLANQMAVNLIEAGVKRNDFIGLCAERSIELVVGILGILKVGAAYVPLDPKLPAERLNFIIQDAQLKWIVTQEALEEIFRGISARLIIIEDSLNADDRRLKAFPPIAASPDDPAYLIYTSGSTGAPKGVVVSHYNVVRLFQSTQNRFQFNSDDVWSFFHSFAFDFSVWELWGALLHGGRLVIVPDRTIRDPKAFTHLQAEHKVSVLSQTPSAFYPLLKTSEFLDPELNPSLRLIIFGGEALNVQALQPWFDARNSESVSLVNMYGITETTVHTTYRSLHKSDLEHYQSVIGTPLTDLRIYLMDDYLQPVPFGVTGEIFVGGAGVSGGYLNRPELTAEKFIPDPFSHRPGDRLYRSGDLARYLSDGDMEYIGRRDLQVKIRGFRVEIGEIEALLSEFPGIRQAAVVLSVPNVSSHEIEYGRLDAYLAVDSRPSVSEIRNFLAKKLPDYMIPVTYNFLPSLPLTANGKVDHRALIKSGSITYQRKKEYQPPQTALEYVLVQLWGDMLELDRVGLLDNFFDLGGHSLLAIRLTNKINDLFNLELSSIHLFEEPTIAGYANLLMRLSSDPDQLIRIAEIILRLTDLSDDQARIFLDDK